MRPKPLFLHMSSILIKDYGSHQEVFLAISPLIQGDNSLNLILKDFWGLI